jgi:hypothetical protein
MIALLAAPLLLGSTVEEVPLGLEGDACEARSDCQPDFRCLQHVCRGERREEQPVEIDREPEEARPKFEYEGTHGWLGVSMGGAGVFFAPQRSGREVAFGGFVASLHGGVTIDRVALGFELTPASEGLVGEGGTIVVFQGNATIGYLIPLGRIVSVPLRGGFGGGFIPAPSIGLFEARADLVGLLFTVPVGNQAVILETHFPSFRWMTDFNLGHFLTWIFDVGVSYAF